MWEHVGISRGGRARIRGDLTSGVPYIVSVVPRSKAGDSRSPDYGAQRLVTLHGRRERPEPVAGLAEVTHRGWATLCWDRSPGADVAAYEVRSGTHWLGARVLARTTDCRVMVPISWVTTETLRVRSITRSGVWSESEGTVSVMPSPVDYNVTTSTSQNPGWTGTKTDMSVSGTTLVWTAGGAMTGSYVAQISMASSQEWKVLVNLDSDIVPVPLTIAMLPMSMDSDYLARHTIDELDYWEGIECEGVTIDDYDGVAMNHAYLSGRMDSLPQDFSSTVSVVVDWRASTNGGTTWGAWRCAMPIQETMDALQVRVTVTTPHDDIVPRLNTMALHVGLPASVAQQFSDVSDEALSDDDIYFYDSATGKFAPRQISASDTPWVTASWPGDDYIASWAGNTIVVHSNRYGAQVVYNAVGVIGYKDYAVPLWHDDYDGTNQLLLRMTFSGVGAGGGSTQTWPLIYGLHVWQPKAYDAGSLENLAALTTGSVNVSVPASYTAGDAITVDIGIPISGMPSITNDGYHYVTIGLLRWVGGTYLSTVVVQTVRIIGGVS